METLIPFMLFLLQPPAGGTDKPALIRHPVVFETEAQCLVAAKKLQEEAMKGGGRSLHTYCVAMPQPAEFEAMLKSIEARVAREREGNQ